jgi:hypothetical protein
MVIISKHKSDYLKAIIPIATVLVVIASIIIGFVIFSPSTGIQKYDTVEIDYTVWVSDENEQYDVFNPVLDAVLWVSMLPITENETAGIILGLYNNLLDKNKYHDSGLIWLNRCVDELRDGIDDNTGQPALSYGNSADLYFDTCLMIQFQVLNIERPPDSPQFTSQEEMFLIVLGIIIISIGAGATILIGGYYLNNYRKHRQERPKKVKDQKFTRKELIIKYSLLGSILGGVVLSVMGLTSLYFPLDLILQLNPGIVWVMVILILIIWAAIIPLYLLIYRVLKRK